MILVTNGDHNKLLAELEASMAEADAINAQVETSAKGVNVTHYQRGGLECIEVMRAISTRAEFVAHCKLSAFKYLWRLGYKGDPVADAIKAETYTRWMRERLEAE